MANALAEATTCVSARADRIGQLSEPFVAEARVHRIKNRDLLVEHDIRVIRHAVFHHILPLEQVDVVVVHADVADVLRNLQLYHPFFSRLRAERRTRGLPTAAKQPFSLLLYHRAWPQKIGKQKLFYRLPGAPRASIRRGGNRARRLLRGKPARFTASARKTPRSMRI